MFSYAKRLFPQEVRRAVEVMNDFVEEMRQEASLREFKRVVRRFDRAARKRALSLDCYIDALFEKYARMVVIRVDLSYEVGYFSGMDLRQRLSRAKEDWAKMQMDLHKGVPIKEMLGFACKLEYGHLKGFHFHLLAFYNGSTYRKDVLLARLIGEHWRNVVAKGQGLYYNCNKKKGKYKYLGIGVISHKDVLLIRNLKTEVAQYLVKIDYWIRLFPDCGRSFFRGNMPALDSAKKGRPRRLAKT